MARTKNSTNSVVEKEKTITKITDSAESTNNVSTSQEETIKSLLEMVGKLTEEVQTLKQEKQTIQEDIEVATLQETTIESPGLDAMASVLERLANNKNNKEVVIVHNQEMFGGLYTEIKLSNLDIRFAKIGEQRVLTWQQFEELVSKYRGFINDKIILVDSEYEELSERYGIGVYYQQGKNTLTASSLEKLGKLEPRQLEDFFKSLDTGNQKMIISYWLGKCYEDPSNKDFYDRYKIELLNNLSKTRVFDNIIGDINAQDIKDRKQEDEGQVETMIVR